MAFAGPALVSSFNPLVHRAGHANAHRSSPTGPAHRPRRRGPRSRWRSPANRGTRGCCRSRRMVMAAGPSLAGGGARARACRWGPGSSTTRCIAVALMRIGGRCRRDERSGPRSWRRAARRSARDLAAQAAARRSLEGRSRRSARCWPRWSRRRRPSPRSCPPRGCPGRRCRTPWSSSRRGSRRPTPHAAVAPPEVEQEWVACERPAAIGDRAGPPLPGGCAGAGWVRGLDLGRGGAPGSARAVPGCGGAVPGSEDLVNPPGAWTTTAVRSGHDAAFQPPRRRDGRGPRCRCALDGTDGRPLRAARPGGVRARHGAVRGLARRRDDRGPVDLYAVRTVRRRGADAEPGSRASPGRSIRGSSP